MKWELHTTNASIGVGTRFHVLDTPQVAGQPANRLPPHCLDVWIDPTWGRMFQVQTGAPCGAGMELIMPGGQVWIIEPLPEGEIGSGIATKGMHTSEWWIVAAWIDPSGLTD